VVILAAIALAGDAISLLPGRLVVGDAPLPDQASRLRYAIAGTIGTGLRVALLYPLARVILWPVGLLAGDARAGLAYAWRMTGGWSGWAFVLATLLSLVPAMLIGVAGTFVQMQTRAFGPGRRRPCCSRPSSQPS
jgi:hypothetical protein